MGGLAEKGKGIVLEEERGTILYEPDTMAILFWIHIYIQTRDSLSMLAWAINCAI